MKASFALFANKDQCSFYFILFYFEKEFLDTQMNFSLGNLTALFKHWIWVSFHENLFKVQQFSCENLNTLMMTKKLQNEPTFVFFFATFLDKLHTQKCCRVILVSHYFFSNKCCVYIFRYNIILLTTRYINICF